MEVRARATISGQNSSSREHAAGKIPVAILAVDWRLAFNDKSWKIPKSLVPVAGEPYLAHQLKLLHARGIRRAVLCIGYLGEMIQRDFGGEAFGVVVITRRPKTSSTPTYTIKRALPLLGRAFLCSTAILICR